MNNKPLTIFTAILLIAFNALLIANIYLMITKPKAESFGPHYVLEMYDDGILLTDPDTNTRVYFESYDSDSEIVKALIKENQ